MISYSWGVRVGEFWKSWSVTTKRTIQALWDAASWVVGSIAAMYIRFDFQPTVTQLKTALVAGLIFGLVQLIMGWFLHLYRGRYRIGSLDEVSGVTSTAGLIALASTLVVVLMPQQGVPRSLPILAAVLSLSLMMAGRVTMRFVRLRSQRREPGTRTLILGAGDMGEHLLRLMFADKDKAFTPVAFLDDDPSKRRLRLFGVRVLGTSSDLERVAQAQAAEVLIVAVTRITSGQLQQLDERCSSIGIELRVVPAVAAGLGRSVALRDVGQVSVEDLLGRQPVHVDEGPIKSFIEGKRVLITGAGGSIGSELVRQVRNYSPAAVAVVDRDESAMQAVQLMTDGHGLLNSSNLILADIRDIERVTQVMIDFKPDVVFHAAALKHLPFLEMYPDEAFKTNVLGTANVLRAARLANVKVFVNVSTDKAADPSSILGASKWMTEVMTASVPTTNGRYMSVRFGNVLASRGSVLHLFSSQIGSGGPVTVTHPEVTRYFMTISEAVHLVLQASALGESGSTLILDMGTPVSIDHVARTMIKRSRREIEIEYVGLRHGEKLHEALVSQHESPLRTPHDRIFRVQVSPIPWTDIESSQQLALRWRSICEKVS